MKECLNSKDRYLHQHEWGLDLASLARNYYFGNAIAVTATEGGIYIARTDRHLHMDTQFDIASISKVYLSALIHKLAAEKQLSLNDVVCSGVRVNDLLNNNVLAEKHSWEDLRDYIMNSKYDIGALWKKLQQLTFTKKAQYSNMSSMLLSVYLQVKFEKTLQDLFDECLPQLRVKISSRPRDFADAIVSTKSSSICDPTARKLFKNGIQSLHGGLFASANQLLDLTAVMYSDMRHALDEAFKQFKRNDVAHYLSSFYIPSRDSEIFAAIDEAHVFKSGFVGAFIAMSANRATLFLSDMALRRHNYPGFSAEKTALYKIIIEKATQV